MKSSSRSQDVCSVSKASSFPVKEKLKEFHKGIPFSELVVEMSLRIFSSSILVVFIDFFFFLIQQYFVLYTVLG